MPTTIDSELLTIATVASGHAASWASDDSLALLEPTKDGRELRFWEHRISVFEARRVGAPEPPLPDPREPITTLTFQQVSERLNWSGRKLRRHIAFARRAAATRASAAESDPESGGSEAA